jgi:hypothetical protein
MKALVIILSILIFSACLYIGILAGSSSTPLPFIQDITPDVGSPVSGQRTIIVTAVDDLTSASPRLVSVWIIFFRLGTPHLSALPLYPPSSVSGSASQKLAAAFNLTPEKQPSAEYTAALKEFHFPWSGMILVDRLATAALVDWLGGVNQAGVQLDGDSAVGILIDPWSDPSAGLQSQVDLGNSLCSAADQSTSLDWQILLTAIGPNHIQADMNVEGLVGELVDILNLNQSFSCEIVTSVE